MEGNKDKVARFIEIGLSASRLDFLNSDIFVPQLYARAGIWEGQSSEIVRSLLVMPDHREGQAVLAKDPQGLRSALAQAIQQAF